MTPAASPAAPHAPLPNERRREALVLAFAALLIVLVTTGAALMLWRAREDALNTWRQYVLNFSATAAEHASQTLKSGDYALGAIVDHVQSHGVDSEAALREVAGKRSVYDFIRERASELPLLDVATIVALDGQVLASSRSFPPAAINLADRDYHKAHLADPSLTLYVSSPMKNRGTGRWTFYLARKIRSPSGQPIGLALAGIQSSYFERFYRSINLSETDSNILLLRSDGTLLARHPPRPEALGMSYRDTPFMRALANAQARGQQVASVSTEAPRTSDPGDTQQRMTAVHAVADFPLAVSIAARETLMLGPWRLTAKLCMAGVLVLDVAIAAMALYIHALLRRQRAALQQLDEARAAAETAASVKSQFLANLSQEVRTPLQGLQGLAQRMLESPLQPAQRQQAQIIERTGRMLLDVIDDVLDFSSATAAGVVLEVADVDLARLGRDCVALFEAQARLKGLVLHLELEPQGHPTLVRGDPLRLSQMLNQLLSSAMKHATSGSVTLRIARTGPQRWRFAVHNTGVGLMPQLPAPPSESTSASATTTSRLGSSGLGLTTMQRLVQLMGGTVDERNAPGQSSDLWCEVPLEGAERVKEAAQESTVSS